MPKRPATVDVEKIRAEVEGPTDKAARRDDLRFPAVTQSISGSGGSGTVFTNNSARDAHLIAVTATALGATAGTVLVTAQIKDGNGNVEAELTGDVAGGMELQFGGYRMPNGYKLDYSISQNDANSYDVDIYARTRNALKLSDSQTEDDETSNPVTIVDGFEDGDIAEYTGSTADFSVQSTLTFDGDFALETSAVATIISTSGLDTYPAKGDTVRCYMWNTEGFGSNESVFDNFYFGVQDTNNHYRVRRDPTKDNTYLQKREGGGSYVTLDDELSGGDFSAETWYKVEVDWGSDGTIVVDIVNTETGNKQSRLSASDTTFTDGGIGFDAHGTAGSWTARWDYVVIP